MINNNIFTFSHFPKEVKHGISTRYFGSVKDSKGWHKESLKTFANALGVSSQPIFPVQKHTGNVQFVYDNASYDNTDGLLTQQAGIIVGVVTADCLPIFFYESKRKIAGIVHAGYKGLLSGIIEEMIGKIKIAGGNSKNILVGIEPAIGVCCYNIPQERAAQFASAFPEFNNFLIQKNDMYFLDLVSIAKQILQKEGVMTNTIEVANICTKDTLDTFFSFRGDTKETFGEFASVIGMI